MDQEEEAAILLETGCSGNLVTTLLTFAEKYRQSLSADAVMKNRKLGTRTLVRIAKRLARGDEDLYGVISRSLLAEFLPAMERLNLENLLTEVGIGKKSTWVCCGLNLIAAKFNHYTLLQFNPSPVIQDNILLFPEVSSPEGNTLPTPIPCFDASLDPEGFASHVPHMDHFYDNSLQTSLMRDLAIDMELLGEHLVLLGNQVSILTFMFEK